MKCDVCQREAQGICSQCGTYYCADHGSGACFRCSGAFIDLETDPDPLETGIVVIEDVPTRSQQGKQYLPCEEKIPLVTVHIDDEEPSCYKCRSYAKYRCENCQVYCCREHVTKTGYCLACERSSRFGLYVVGIILLALVGFVLFGSNLL